MNKEQSKIFKQFLKENINTIDANRLLAYSKETGLSVGSLLEAANNEEIQLNEFQKDSQIRRDNMYSLIVDRLAEIGKGADEEEIYNFIDYTYEILDEVIDIISPQDLWNNFMKYKKGEPETIEETESLDHSISNILKEDEKIEKVDMLDLLTDVTDVSSSLSDLYATLSYYKTVHIDDVEIVKALSELGNGVNILLKKAAMLIGSVSNKI